MNKLVLVLVVFFVTSCAETKDILSMEDAKPLDEFSVMQAPHLDMPPDFNLRPPSGEAKTKVSTKAKIKGEVSENEKEMLEKMNKSDSNPNYKPTDTDEEFLNKLQ